MNSKKLIQVSNLSQRGAKKDWVKFTETMVMRKVSDTMGQDRRISSDPWGWCKCGKCCKMPSKKECLSCKEVESVQYFDLHGK